jgi:DNA ligase-1
MWNLNGLQPMNSAAKPQFQATRPAVQRQGSFSHREPSPLLGSHYQPSQSPPSSLVKPEHYQAQVLFLGRKTVKPKVGEVDPILAVEVEMKKVKYPVIVSPKVDGNRGMVQNGQILGRSLLAIPNPLVQKILSKKDLEGFDGELVAGDPTNAAACAQTTGFMSRTTCDAGDFQFLVFDVMNEPDKPFRERQATLKARYAKLPTSLKKYVKLMPQYTAKNEADVLKYEKEFLKAGYEGLILRSPEAKYASKRANMTDQSLMKLKRFADAEAVVVDCYPLTPSSTAAKSILKSGKLTKDQMLNLSDKEQGAAGYLVRDLKTSAQFKLGTPPMTFEERQVLWKNRGKLQGKIVKYKYFPHGMNPETKVPRHPVMLGFREDFDLPKEMLSIAGKLKRIKTEEADDAA